MDSGAEELQRKLTESQKLIEKQSQEIKELELKLFEKSSVSWKKIQDEKSIHEEPKLSSNLGMILIWKWCLIQLI